MTNLLKYFAGSPRLTDPYMGSHRTKVILVLLLVPEAAQTNSVTLVQQYPGKDSNPRK